MRRISIVVGVGSFGVALATAYQLFSGAPIEVFGATLKDFLIAALIAGGGHELAHWVAAQRCEWDEVEYDISTRAVRSNVLVAAAFSGVLLLDVLDVVSLSPLVAFGGLIGLAVVLEEGLFLSPGAIYLEGRATRFCSATTALVGPLWNAIIGLGIFVGVQDPTGWVSATMWLSLFLGAYNAIPMGPLDGADVWQDGTAGHHFVLFSILLLCAGALYTL